MDEQPDRLTTTEVRLIWRRKFGSEFGILQPIRGR